MGFDKKKYIYDSYLSNYDTHVESCLFNGTDYEIKLDKTIFYPDMVGGQPRDCGTINGLEVKNVIERDNEVIHILDTPIEGEVRLQIDLNRRIDLMQQHTGQHILSSVFSELYHAKTVGFHLSSDYTTIDLNVAGFTDEMISSVEHYANQIIYDNIKIDTEILKREDALKENLRKEPVNDEMIRLVKIGEKDNVACCGTHLSFTGEVGVIKVLKYEKYKSGTRVEFLCGKRALDDYIEKNFCIYHLSNEFSCHVTKLKDSIIKLKEDDLIKTKEISSLKSKLNYYKAQEYIDSAIIINNNLKFIYEKEEEFDVKQLREIANKITDKHNLICVLIAKNHDNFNIIIAKSKDVSYNIRELFKICSDNAEIKGGGNDYILQGLGKNINKIIEIDKIMNRIMQ